MPRSPTQPALPAIHTFHLLELVRRWNVTEAELLGGFRLRREDLENPERDVPLETCVAIFERARQLTREPGLGIYLGLQTRASTHGYLGFAAMTAATLRDAIALAIRYVPIRTTAIAFGGRVEANISALTVEELAGFGTARDFVLLSMVVGLWQAGCALIGRDLECKIDLIIPRPAYFDGFAHILPPTSFDCPANQLAIHSRDLESPLVMADPASLRLAREQCDRMLASLGLDGRLAGRVRALISREDGVPRSFDETARALGVSARTLRRRLTAEGATFASLLHEQRKQRALILLRSGELSIESVARTLGYSSAANFARAFHQWTGKTPTAYRRSRQASLGALGERNGR